MKIKILFIGTQCLNKQSQDLACQPERVFRTKFRCQWLINIIKVLSCRFRHCLCTFTILLVEASSETRLFRHLSNNVFGACNFGNTKSYEGHLFFQRVQNFRQISKMQQNIQKKFFVSEIIAYKLVSWSCPFEEQDTFHRQPMC